MTSPDDSAKYQSPELPLPIGLPSDVVISPDTLRSERVPPGQTRTRKWPVLQYGGIPEVTTAEYRFTVSGLVENPLSLDWNEFQALPRTKVFADFHCVTRWSRLGNLWEGVSVQTIMDLVKVKPEVRFVLALGNDDGWSTNMPLEDFVQEDVLLADLHDGAPLTYEHGGPVRLVVPRLYAWKSAKWCCGLKFLKDDKRGLWEQMGYHDHGDPWVADHRHPDGERMWS